MKFNCSMLFLLASVMFHTAAIKAADILPAEFEIAAPSLKGRCLEVLYKGIDSDNFIYAIHSAEALTAAGQAKFVIYKLEPMLAEQQANDQLLCCVARELVRAGRQQYTQILFDVLQKKDSNAYAHSAEGIFKTDTKIDISILNNALEFKTSPLDRVWLHAAMLKSADGPIEPLRQYIHGDDALIGSVAAFALGTTGNLSPQDVDYITELTAKSKPFEKVLLLSSLWDYRPDETKEGLLQSAASDMPSVRAFAAYSLRHAGDARSIATLLKLLKDENQDVRIRAAHSLIVIRDAIDRKMLVPSEIEFQVSAATVTKGQIVSVAVSNKQNKPFSFIIATPYTVGVDEAVPGFSYDPDLKWSWTSELNIDTKNFKPGVYNLTLIIRYDDAYDYRDFSITVNEDKPPFKAVIEWDKSISDKREGLGSFLKLEDGTALACNFMTTDGGLTWEQSPVAFGYMVCPLADGKIISFSGNVKPLGDGKFTVKVNYYDRRLKEIDSFKAVINLPQFVPGIAHDYYDAPLPIRSIVEMKDGSLICTMYGRFAGDDIPWQWNSYDQRAAKMRMFILKSTDKGRTWNYLSTAGIDTNDATMEGFNESVMGYIPDGRLMALMRSGDNAHSGWENNTMYSVFSSDNGSTWTKPLSTGVESVAPDFCVMKSGTIACSYGRPGVKLMFSTDSGQTWTNSISIHDERYRGYTAICEIEPDVLLVGYRVKNSFSPQTNTRIPDQLRMARIKLVKN